MCIEFSCFLTAHFSQLTFGEGEDDPAQRALSENRRSPAGVKPGMTDHPHGNQGHALFAIATLAAPCVSAVPHALGPCRSGARIPRSVLP